MKLLYNCDILIFPYIHDNQCSDTYHSGVAELSLYALNAFQATKQW
jgi:hypothetical protein